MSVILLQVPMALGDVLDRLTILSIKGERIATDRARANVLKELECVSRAWRGVGLGEWTEDPDAPALRTVNWTLWEVENSLRALEVHQDFGPNFVRYARQVYQLNDRRAALKQQVSKRLGSALVEEKCYASQT